MRWFDCQWNQCCTLRIPWGIDQCLAEKSAASPQHHRVKSWESRCLPASPKLNLSKNAVHYDSVEVLNIICRCSCIFMHHIWDDVLLITEPISCWCLPSQICKCKKTCAFFGCNWRFSASCNSGDTLSRDSAHSAWRLPGSPRRELVGWFYAFYPTQRHSCRFFCFCKAKVYRVAITAITILYSSWIDSQFQAIVS